MQAPHSTEKGSDFGNEVGWCADVRWYMLMFTLRMRLMGVTVMLSSLSQEMGSWHYVRSDSQRRMKIALSPTVVVRLKHALLAMLR